jgi:hypothetical protein
MQAIINDPLMKNSAILVFANKQDMVMFLNLLNFNKVTNIADCISM